jgi:hypothetical protein
MIKNMLGTAAFVTFSALTPAIWAQSAQWQPHVLVVDSLDDVQSWLDAPVAQRAGGGAMREIPAGLKVHFPIVVTSLPALAGKGMHFEADIELLGPKGQTLWTHKACCRKIVRGGEAGASVVLEPAAMVQFEPNDTAGTYSIRATVNDGQRTAVTVETLRFGASDARDASKPPSLRLNMDPPKKNPGADRDVRDCLSLPTPNEVIKCTERK